MKILGLGSNVNINGISGTVTKIGNRKAVGSHGSVNVPFIIVNDKEILVQNIKEFTHEGL
jgi:hypothetical protein